MTICFPNPCYLSLDASGIVTGITPLEGDWAALVGRSLLECLHPGDRQGGVLLSSPEKPKPKRVRWLLGDSVVPIDLTLLPLATATQPDQQLAILQQVAPEAEAGDPVACEDTALYQTLMDRLPNGALLVFDQDLRYVHVGGQGLQAAGYDPQALIGKTMDEALSADLCDRLRPLYQLALAGQEDVIEVADRGRVYQVFGAPLWERGDRHPPHYGLVLSQDISSLRQAEQALQQQAQTERQHRLIAQTSAAFARYICSTLDLDEVLQAAVIQLHQLLEVERVLVYRTYSKTGGKVLVEAVNTPEQSVLRQTPPPEITAAWYNRFQKNQVQTIPNINTEPHSGIDCGFDRGVQAKLSMPIFHHNQLWGVLIAQQLQEPHPWQDWEVSLMQQLGCQLEVAVYQADLYGQVQQLNRDLEMQIHTVQQLNTDLEAQIATRTRQLQQAYDFEATLKRVTDKVRDSLNEDQILQAAVQEVALALQVGGCTAAIYDLDAGTSTVCYEYTTTTLPYQGRVVQLDAFPEAYTELLKGQAIQFCSLIPNPIRGTVATLAVPILDERGVLGDLWLVHHREYAFSEQDIRLVQQVANQCAIAIRQARLYQASMAQVRELEKLNQLKDDFLSTVSHELRTPMSNVKMAIQMLGILLRDDGHSESQAARIERYLQILNEESQREINLINDLLDLSRLDAGMDILQYSAIALPQWIPSIMRTFEEQANHHQQYFDWICPDHLPLVYTDASKLERILTELLGNAFKYTPAQEAITVLIREIKPQQAIQISVTNTGVEIPEAEQERIFEKFYRVPNKNPWQHGGTGLGLALVKQMLQCMHGSITVHSVCDQTRFTIQIPLVPPNAPPHQRLLPLPSDLSSPLFT